MTVNTATEVDPQDSVDDVATESPDAAEISGDLHTDNDVETDAAEVAESSKPTISDATLGRADAYGIPRAELEGLSDAQASRLFATIDRRTMQSPAAQQPQAQQPQQTETPQGYVPYEPEFPEELDEALVGVLKGFTKHVNDHLAGLDGRTQDVIGAIQSQDMVREIEGFDRFIADLGEDWEGEYGKGPTLDMDPNSSEYRTRMEVLFGSRNLRTDAQRRRSPITAKAAHKRAHGGMHYDKIAEREREKLNGKLAKRRRGASERPARGKTGTLSPHDHAVEQWKAGG